MPALLRKSCPCGRVGVRRPRDCRRPLRRPAGARSGLCEPANPRAVSGAARGTGAPAPVKRPSGSASKVEGAGACRSSPHEVWAPSDSEGRIVVARKDRDTVSPGTIRSIRPASGLEYLRWGIHVVVYEQADDGAWGAFLLDLPGVVALGTTRSEVTERIREALSAFADDLRDRRRSLPAPDHAPGVVAAWAAPHGQTRRVIRRRSRGARSRWPCRSCRTSPVAAIGCPVDVLANLRLTGASGELDTAHA